jgi:hypothetical protein
MLKKIQGSVLLVIATTAILCAQQGLPSRPSPAASAQCELPGGKAISVEYSSPRMRGRKIFGGLVPYGQVWRTGANEATTFVSNENLVSAGATNIPAGRYTIFTIPNADKWTLIINKHTGESGTPYTYESEELARVPTSLTKLATPVENFTFSLDPTATGCTMHISWENTGASVALNLKNTDIPVIR